MTRTDSTTITADQADTESARGFDPYALDPSSIENPPRKLSRAILQIGPGLILAGSIVGTGELIATTNLGARVGFALLWLVILSCLLKVFVQTELGRHAISSGQTSLQTFARLPGPGLLLVWWVALMTLVTQFQLGAMVGMVGQAMHMAIPSFGTWVAAQAPGPLGPYLAKPENLCLPWALLTALSTAALLAVGTYKLVERATTLFVVTFTLTTVACVVLLPFAGQPIRWDQVGHGLKFQIPDKAALLAAFAMFGITGVGATELIAYPYWCIEKGYARKTGPRPEPPQYTSDALSSAVLQYETHKGALAGAAGEAWTTRARGWLRVLRLDAWVSMVIYTLATLAFYFLGAAVLHKGPGSPGLPDQIDRVLGTLASMYQPVLGQTLALIFIIVGAFAVLYSTLFAATAGNARIFADTLWTSGLARVDSHRQRRRWIVLFVVLMPLLDFVLFVLFGNPKSMVIVGGVAQALALPVIGMVAVFLRFRRTDPRLAPSRLWDLFLWVSMLSFCVAAGYVLFDKLKDLPTLFR
jgi:Mn2+/Fe2+ NRAMP family transporter